MKVATKTHILSKPNGVFVWLLDYEAEDDLGLALALVERRLGLAFPPVQQGPYSSYASAEIDGHMVTVSADSDIGCYLRFEPGEEGAAKDVAVRLYPT